MGWVLTHEGQVYRESDLTIDESVLIEEAALAKWGQINPLRSARHARAILQTFLVTRAGLAPDVASKEVGAMKVSAFLDALSYEDGDEDLPSEYVDGNPPVADEPSTPG